MDHSIPFDRSSGWTFGDPMRLIVIQYRYRFQMIHEPRQILKIAPEAEELFGRTVDDDTAFDLHPFAMAHAGLRRLAGLTDVSRVDLEQTICLRSPGDAAL